MFVDEAEVMAGKFHENLGMGIMEGLGIELRRRIRGLSCSLFQELLTVMGIERLRVLNRCT